MSRGQDGLGRRTRPSRQNLAQYPASQALSALVLPVPPGVPAERLAQRRTQKSGIGGISRARELYSWLTGRGVVTTSQASDLVSAATESKTPSARTVRCRRSRSRSSSLLSKTLKSSTNARSTMQIAPETIKGQVRGMTSRSSRCGAG